MRIPEVQERLRAVAGEIAAMALNYADLGLFDYSRTVFELANELSRRKPVKRARASARKASDGLRAMIRDYADHHPEASNREIGRFFNVDGGRVSEAIAGFRE